MQKIKDGALFAVGFTIVAIAITYAYSSIIATMYDSDDFMMGQSTDDITVLESRIVKRDDRLVVLGKYQNDGDQSWSSLTIKADFFGVDDSFLDQCEEYSSGSLESGQEAYFRLECSSCADLTLDDVASHKVYVADGY
jgi:hypothetical protein